MLYSSLETKIQLGLRLNHLGLDLGLGLRLMVFSSVLRNTSYCSKDENNVNKAQSVLTLFYFHTFLCGNRPRWKDTDVM